MHECFVWLPAVRGLVVTSPSDQELHGRSALVIEEDEDDEVGLLALSSLLSPGLWIVWVSMISGTCPHRSHSSLEHAWILTNDEIHCGQGRPGPWIV